MFDISKFSSAMSQGYWMRWNEDVQNRIDRDIEANRKADGSFRVDGIPAGAEVKVEQTESEFIFGAHIFNFDQLGTDERNAKYKALYGTLFNSATIAFYWQTLEPEEGKPRFRAEYRDTADFWGSVCTDTRLCGAATAGRFPSGSLPRFRSMRSQRRTSNAIRSMEPLKMTQRMQCSAI